MRHPVRLKIAHMGKLPMPLRSALQIARTEVPATTDDPHDVTHQTHEMPREDTPELFSAPLAPLRETALEWRNAIQQFRPANIRTNQPQWPRSSCPGKHSAQ